MDAVCSIVCWSQTVRSSVSMPLAVPKFCLCYFGRFTRIYSDLVLVVWPPHLPLWSYDWHSGGRLFLPLPKQLSWTLCFPLFDSMFAFVYSSHSQRDTYIITYKQNFSPWPTWPCQCNMHCLSVSWKASVRTSWGPLSLFKTSVNIMTKHNHVLTMSCLCKSSLIRFLLRQFGNSISHQSYLDFSRALSA